MLIAVNLCRAEALQKAEQPGVAAMQNVTRRRAVLMRRHLATQQQGDWTAVAARDYASHRQTFQADYARDCWRRLSSRPAVAPVVARAARVLDVGCGSGEFTRELAELLAHRTIVGLDVSSDMVAHARAANAHERVSYTVADLANDGPRGERFQVATSTMALHWPGPDPSVSGRCFEPASSRAAYFSRACMVLGRARRASTRSKKSRAWTWRASPPCSSAAPRPRGKRALCDAGFVDVEVEERTVATRYASAADCRRLAAAWPPILSGHVPDAEIDALVAAAARVMMEAMAS